jgi:DNA-binding response OmpR family regulator
MALRALIVDDDPDIVQVLAEFVRGEGFADGGRAPAR